MTAPWVDQATAAFEAALGDLLGAADPLTDPVNVGRTAALEAMAGALWSEDLGPFYSSESVATLLGNVTKQAVSDRVRRHRLLALRTGSGRLVYPAFQFDRRQVISGLGAVLTIVAPDDTESWYVASWLTTPDPRLGGLSPVDALTAGRVEDVKMAARDVAASLRG